MTRAAKAADNIQVFRGSYGRPDVFAQNSSNGCCGPGVDLGSFDRLADRVHFDNGLIHSNPLGANDKFAVPGGNGFGEFRREIVDHINTFGVGAEISVLVIPTFAFVTGVSIHVRAEEEGLTFNLKTRNGLVLPATAVKVVSIAAGEGCDVVRTLTAGSIASYAGFGGLADGELAHYIIGREGEGEFALEADEIIVEVASIPGTPVTGAFDFTVAVSYEIVDRCAEPV